MVRKCLRFATREEAEANVQDLMMRWFAVRETRVVTRTGIRLSAFVKLLRIRSTGRSSLCFLRTSGLVAKLRARGMTRPPECRLCA